MRISVTILLAILFTLIPAALFLYVIVLAIRALRTYIRTNGVRQEKNQIKRTLGEALKEHRLRCQMTQESVGVSRQAVSKWERGDSDPSTSNLLALAKLFGISAEELLRNVGSPEHETGAE